MSNPSLFSAVLELINTESETERQRVLERQRDVLLTDEAEQLLSQWLAQSQGDHTRTLQERHQLLVRCRKVGIQAAFAPPIAPPPSKAKIREALFALMGATSLSQRRQIIEQAQEVLLADATTEFLEAWIENEADFAEDDTLRTWRDCQALLARCREIGIHAAFAQQPTETTSSPSQSIPPAFAADIQRAMAAHDRSDMDRSPQALNAAVEAWQMILARPDIAQYPEFRVMVRSEFAGTLLSRYQAFGQVADLEEAIKVCQQALKQTPIGSPDRLSLLNNLGNALINRFRLHGQAADLEEAIKVCQQALKQTPIGSPDRLSLLNNLGNALINRFRLYGQVADLEEAIKVCQQALKQTPIGSPNRPSRLNNLGNALMNRFRLHGQVVDLEEAITVLQQALKQTPIGSPNRPSLLNNLGMALRNRFSQHGQVADLEEAIRVYQQVLKETPTSSPKRPYRLNNLAAALSERFRLHGQVADLEEAITVYQQALDETPIGTPARPAYLNNLGWALRNRFRLQGQVADLEEAITVHQQALDETPIGSPDRPRRLNNLGNALSNRFIRNGQVADLEEAITVYQQALKETPIGSPDRAAYLNNLGPALSERFKLHGQVADLEEAITVYQQALNSTPIGSLDRPMYLNNLGVALSERFKLHGQVADLEEAITVYREGLSLVESGVNPMERRHLARHLGDLYYEQTQEFSEAYEAYVEAAEAAEAIRQGVRSEEARQKQARENAQIYARLVHCCLELGKEEEAFHYATAAKGRAFVDLLSTVPLDLSKAQDDELQKKVNRAEKIRAQLDHILAQLTGEVGNSSQLDTYAPTLRDVLTEKRKSLLQEEETLWLQIRNEHPDYFATQAADPLTLKEALQLAAHLKATLLSYYRHANGWVAFVVRDEAKIPLQVVELKVKDETLISEWENFDDNLSSCPQNKKSHLNAWYKALIKPLHSVLPAPTLEESQEGQHKRLVVAPFSVLHLVPLASLRHRRKRQRSFYLNEEYDLTITPSLAVLNRIMKRSPQPVREKLCAIAYPGKMHYLPNVVPEAEAIAKLFSNPTMRLNTNATRQAALDHAPNHQIHHYACHGIFDAEQVQHSGLLLAGGQLLSLRDLFNELRMADNSALTVLSACQTGQVQLQSGDELAGLLQGFVYAGTPAIIASLWAVNDAATRYLFERFYCYYTNGIAATTALRTAQQEMRQRGYDHPYYWAAFQPFGATFQQEANAALACSAALEDVIPTHQPRHMQGADEMSNNLTDERLIDDALDLISHFQSDVEELYDRRNDEQLDAFLATLNSWAAQTETISDEEALLAFANTLITHIEGTPHLCLFFRGHIDAQAHQDAREILRQDRKKRQVQTPVREKIKGYEEPKSVANTMNSGIKKAIALLKEEMEG